MVYKGSLTEIKSIIVWGCGEYFWGNRWRIGQGIEILFIVDNNADNKKDICKAKGITCMYPEEIDKYPNVPIMISVRNRSVCMKIAERLDDKGREYFYIDELVKINSSKAEQNQINIYNKMFYNIQEPGDKDKLKYFLSVSVPVKACNLQCDYCYISHHEGINNNDTILPSAEFIVKALSRKRIGGTALINLCGVGETLLCKELPQIVDGLLQEGHYISIITNATMKNQIDKYLRFEDNKRERLFFKCSLHYLQLKKKKLLKVYADNVKALRDSGISISVEVVPDDALEPYIEELKKYCIDNFGALPQLSVPRDERVESLPILSRHNDEEFLRIWNDFDSDMFRMKMKERQKREEYCHVGEYASVLELDTGNLRPCPSEDFFYNAYENLSEKIVKKAVGNNCKSSHCFVGHAYLTLGMIDEWNEYSYLDIRDRECEKWGHWVTPQMACIYNQRICDNM